MTGGTKVFVWWIINLRTFLFEELQHRVKQMELNSGDSFNHNEYGDITVCRGLTQYHKKMVPIDERERPNGKMYFVEADCEGLADLVEFKIEKTGAVVTEPLPNFIEATVGFDALHD